MTNREFCLFCEAAAREKTMYMWGTFGNKITKDLISKKKAQYPNRYSEKRLCLLRAKADGETIGCDCAGLIKWALWTDCDISKAPRYSSSTDRGTAGLYRAAKEKGLFSQMPDIDGLVVYKEGHVGVSVGNGDVIECTLGSRGDGVVKTRIEAAGWTHWLKIPEVEYQTEEKRPEISVHKKKVTVLDKLKKIIIRN